MVDVICHFQILHLYVGGGNWTSCVILNQLVLMTYLVSVGCGNRFD